MRRPAIITRMILTVFLAILLQVLFLKSVAAQTVGASLEFKKDLIRKENEVYILPIYLSTGEKTVSAVEIKINSSGNLDLMGLQVSGSADIQEVFSYVKDKKAYLSFTAKNITSGINSSIPKEVAALKFVAIDQEPIVFSIDSEKTMVVDLLTDENILLNFDKVTFTGDSLARNSSIDKTTAIPVENQNNNDPDKTLNSDLNKSNNSLESNDNSKIAESQKVSEKMISNNNDQPANFDEKEKNEFFNNQIILIIVAIVLVAFLGGGFFLFFRNKNKQETIESNVESSIFISNNSYDSQENAQQPLPPTNQFPPQQPLPPTNQFPPQQPLPPTNQFPPQQPL